MQPAFLLRTTLTPDETRFNYTIFDNPALDLLTSEEAVKVCSRMMHIYTRLRRAPWKWFDSNGVLLIHGDGTRTAWEILCELAGVASATLNKAIQWMKQQQIIGYWAGKNNAGIRIFFNVASGSIKPNPQKNLRLVPTSSDALRTSANEVAFNEENSVFFKEIQDSDNRAGARAEETPAATEPELHELPLFASWPPDLAESPTTPPATTPEPVAPRPQPSARLHLVPRTPSSTETEELRELVVQAVRTSLDTQRAIQELAARVPDQNWRDWIERSALPKAVRVLFSEWYKKKKAIGRGQPKIADVGASQPIVTDDDLAEWEAVLRADPQYACLYEQTEQPKEQP